MFAIEPHIFRNYGRREMPFYCHPFGANNNTQPLAAQIRTLADCSDSNKSSSYHRIAFLNNFSDKVLRRLSNVGGWLEDKLQFSRIQDSRESKFIVPILTAGNSIESVAADLSKVRQIFGSDMLSKGLSLFGKLINGASGLGDALVSFHRDYESCNSDYANTISQCAKTIGQMSAGGAAAYALGGLGAAASAPALATGALIVGGGALTGYGVGKLYDWGMQKMPAFYDVAKSAVDRIKSWF